ncbi:hypothetical protein F4778DRAFT_451013 [Xylariomycetidae sp. FL2044]|nr:hypothetical protein F4778DRAFT_451013 [Xylariomycetidae sp. FL2044]
MHQNSPFLPVAFLDFACLTAFNNKTGREEKKIIIIFLRRQAGRALLFVSILRMASFSFPLRLAPFPRCGKSWLLIDVSIPGYFFFFFLFAYSEGTPTAKWHMIMMTSAVIRGVIRDAKKECQYNRISFGSALKGDYYCCHVFPFCPSSSSFARPFIILHSSDLSQSAIPPAPCINVAMSLAAAVRK